MSKIKNGGLDQYGAEPFEHRQFGTAGVGGVNRGTMARTIKLGVNKLPKVARHSARVVVDRLIANPTSHRNIP